MAAVRRRRGARAHAHGAVLAAIGAVVLAFSAPGTARADAASRAASLEGTVTALAHTPALDRVRGVNRFFNRFPYRADREVWGREDHWASPDQLIRRGAGDCEDLAIAKYFTLRRLGFTADSLRLSYVRSLRSGRSHMVLLVLRPGAPTLVLDSLDDSLRTLRARRDLVPIYGVNEERVTVSVPGGGERSFPHAGRWVVRNWQAVLARVSARGWTASGRAATLLAAATAGSTAYGD